MVFSPGSMKPHQRKVQSCKKANGDVGEQGGNRCEDLKERDVDLTNRFLATTAATSLTSRRAVSHAVVADYSGVLGLQK